MAPTVITVTGTWKNPEGDNATGKVFFTLAAPILDGSGNVMVGRHRRQANLSSGAISIDLYATNEPGTTPTGNTYLVEEVLDGVPKGQQASYSVEIPYDAASSTIDLADIAPATSTSVSYGATSVDGQTGAVDLSGSYAAIVPPSGDTSGATDTAALQAAFDAGICRLTPGTYWINDYLTFPSSAVIQGPGRDACTIKVVASGTGGIKSEDFDTNTGTTNAAGQKGFHLSGFTIHGNRRNSASGDGLSIYGAAYTLTDLTIVDCDGYGLHTEGNGTGGGAYGWLSDISLEARFTRLHLQDNTSGNWWHRGPNDSIASGITACIHDIGSPASINNVYCSSYGSSLQLSDSHFWGAQCEHQLRTDVGAHRLTNVVLEGATAAQWYVNQTDGSGFIAQGLHVFGTDTAGQKGVEIIGASTVVLDMRGGTCPDGLLVLGASGDYGKSVFRVASGEPLSEVVTGTVHKTSRLEFTNASGPQRSVPSCRIYASGTTTIPNNSITAVAFAAETADGPGWHDNSTNNTRVTVTIAGFYHVSACAQLGSFTNTNKTLLIRSGGSTNIAQASQPQAGTRWSIDKLVYLAAGDYIELCCYQTSGTDQTVQSGSANTWMNVVYVGT